MDTCKEMMPALRALDRTLVPIFDMHNLADEANHAVCPDGYGFTSAYYDRQEQDIDAAIGKVAVRFQLTPKDLKRAYEDKQHEELHREFEARLKIKESST